MRFSTFVATIVILIQTSFVAHTLAMPMATSSTEAFTLRQATAEQIITRQIIKFQRAKLNRMKEEDLASGLAMSKTKRLAPQPKVSNGATKTYPTCNVAGVNGYARYVGWDLYNDDLAGNPHYTKTRTEADSIALCNDNSNCAGAVIIEGGPSYLKGYKVSSGNFLPQPEGITTTMYLDLIGQCSDWAPYVPAAADAICCNSYGTTSRRS
ncbi:hypothetical protein BD324DRAFT_280259 [Kockovaella imperatae]|uniref:Uncharacterized protein n=1 Tax=Kockovaella imperatae TaxID=4999 RepID=A0A1Y1U5X0_9TREE|nr:hypothetical protein BD324DRAFT_280259 [Kockovaella imperatae]ORX33433.1 hypothetical protein BD324DRAFT_280259 [Kockovaella imperatae]